MSIHVRDIINTLSYSQLVRDGIIPNVTQYLLPSSYQIKRYPPFVYTSKNFSYFGMFMDYVIRGYLRIYSQVDLGEDTIVSSASPHWKLRYHESRNMNDIVLASDYFTSCRLNTPSPYDSTTLNKYVPTIVNICKEIHQQLSQYITIINPPYQFNIEYNCQEVTAHPDIVTQTAVLDIKNTSSFLKMSEESILQVLAYYSLLRPSYPNMQYVGFILPMQRFVSLCNVHNWDTSRYLQLLLSQAQTLSLYAGPAVPNIIVSSCIGSHIHKGDNLLTSIQANNLPACQMFLTNPRGSASRSIPKDELSLAAQVLSSRQTLFFTHAPYVINLCKPLDWELRVLESDLTTTHSLGGRGVVVHTGQYTTQDYATAMNNMETQVRQVIKYASQTCPLLLETPCGEGTEVCATLSELAKFFTRFNPEERKYLGLCVDTCHVFAAGYDPVQYLTQWADTSDIPICLVHYNDSKDPLGSRKDHHMIPGLGYIGYERMKEVLVYCLEKGIPMVRE